MYGHVFETWGTKEVLPSRPLTWRITFKDLLWISILRSINFVNRWSNGKNKATRCKIVLHADAVDDWERFHGTRLCCERVLSHSRPNTYIVYLNKGRACRSDGPRFSLSLVSVLCPSRTSLLPACLRYRVYIDSICIQVVLCKNKESWEKLKGPHRGRNMSGNNQNAICIWSSFCLVGQ